mgnify:CR=1 FL=1
MDGFSPSFERISTGFYEILCNLGAFFRENPIQRSPRHPPCHGRPQNPDFQQALDSTFKNHEISLKINQINFKADPNLLRCLTHSAN